VSWTTLGIMTRAGAEVVWILMRMRSVVVALLLFGVLSASVTAAGNERSYNQHGIHFRYPASWQVVPNKSVSNLVGEMVTASKGIVKVAADSGIARSWDNGQKACGAVLVRTSVVKSYQKSLQHDRSKFIAMFERGIRSAKSTKVLDITTGAFAGQAKAVNVVARSRVNGYMMKEAIYLAIATDAKSIDVGIFTVVPAKVWGSCSKVGASIAASSRFR
jgi:hypothetical protein